MTTHSNNQPAAAPQSAPTPAPQQVWRYPFSAANGKEITDPEVIYRALGRMEDGYFPLGVNGFPHGGIHFGAGSARDLDQSTGVRVIANGEIVAFRLDDAYEHIRFTQDHRWGMYSTGFVLVRHRMTMPSAPGSSAAQPADETLTFYSLYMHMADWQTYLADGNLVRPGWWPGVDAFRIGNKDQQTASDGNAGATGAFACQGPGGKRVGFLPENSEVIIGEKRGAWGHIKSITSGAMVSPTSGGYFGQEGGPQAPCVRPDGDANDPTPLTSEGDWGWIDLHDQRAVKEPQGLGNVVVPPQPIQVSAGTLLGQPGEYHDYERSTPMPPVPARQLLHLEVFAGEELSAFIGKSRERAAHLPADERTILLISAGAKLVQKPADPDLTLGQWRPLQKVEPTQNSPKVGRWVLVQPWRHDQFTTLTVKDGDPVWVERGDQAQFKSPNGLKAWSRFPLQLNAVADPANGAAFAMPYAQLGKVTAGHSIAADDKGVNWWRIEFGTADNKKGMGWVCSKDHPGTSWESPWAWPGFEIVDATGINLAEAFRRNLVVCGNVDWKERDEFEPSVAAVNGSPLFRRLEQTIARQPRGYNERPEQGRNGEEVVTARKLQRAMATSWLASELAHVILRYESEWGGGTARWDAITPLMRNARENWECELTRIRKLQWWDEVKDKVAGFPASPVVNHIHPVALVGNFYSKRSKITVAMLRKIWSSAFVSDGTLSDLANQINENVTEYKLDTEQRLTHFFSQVRTEVGPLFNLVESFDYSSSGLKGQFSYFRAHPADAELYCRNSEHSADQEKIANRAYNGINGVAVLGNGSIESGDGWKFRGRGLKQLTGRYNYTHFNSAYPSIWPGENVDFVRNPDLLGQMRYGVRSAVFFWLRGKLHEIADQTTSANTDGQIDKVTAVVNRQTGSYGERRHHYHEIMVQRIFERFEE